MAQVEEEDGGPVPAGRPRWTGPGEDADDPRRALDALAGWRATGVLVVEGRPAGRIFLEHGQVVWAEVPDLPVPQADAGFAWSGGLNGEVARLRTLVDRVYVLCNSRPRAVHFEPDRAAPTGAPLVAFVPGRLLAELDRRADAMAGMTHPVHPLRDRVVAERRLYRSVQAAMTPGELDLVAAVNGRRTSLELAAHLGRGVYATALDVARLSASDVVSLRRSSAAPGTGGLVLVATGAAPLPDRTPGQESPDPDDGERARPAAGIVVVTSGEGWGPGTDPAAPPQVPDEFVSTEPRLFQRVLNALRGPDGARRDPTSP